MVKASTLSEFISRTETAYADKTAFVWRPVFRKEGFTYQEIGRMARQVACLLQARGVRQGDPVILWDINSPYWVSAFFGCQIIGAVAVPLMIQNTPEFVLRIREVTGAKVILKSQLVQLDTDALCLDLIPELKKGTLHDTPEAAVVNPGDPAEILFTSGTTGTPKGVIIKHSNILSNLEDIEKLELILPSDRLLSILPLAHSFEQVASLFTAQALGLTVSQAVSLSGSHIRMIMAEDQPTVIVAVPEFLKLMIAQIEAKAEEQGRGDKLQKLFQLGPKIPMPLRRRLARQILARFGGRLRLVVSGGSALDPAVGDKWEAMGVMVIQGYGATECSPVISANTIADRSSASVGYPLPSVQVQLAEDQEILVKGPNVVDGYYNRPEETAARFKDGWYYTDDLGQYDDKGRLYIKGRKKFLIVTPGGENVYPEDIENELNKQPEVKDSAVLAWEPDGRFEIHAILLPKLGASIPDPGEFTQRVNKTLQPQQRMHGASVYDCEDFPRTVTRKVKKNELKDWLKARAEGGGKADLVVEVGAIERAIAKAAHLSPEKILPEMKLESDLKMDSLGRVTLVGIIEEDLGVALDESQITAETTVADIHRKVMQREQKQEVYEFNPRPTLPATRFKRLLLQRLLVWPVTNLFAPMKVIGRENLEGLETPALFFPNHISPADPLIVLKALPSGFQTTTASAAAADLLYEDARFSKYRGILETIGFMYPFAREGQIKSSIQYTARLMDRGFNILLFPEGRMSRDAKLLPIKAGIGLIAVEMRAPVVPVTIEGAEKIVPPDSHGLVVPKRSRVTVTFGKPIHFEEGVAYDQAANRIFQVLAEMLGPEKVSLAENIP